MATQNMQAMQLIAPDIAQEQQQLSRRQQMADLLRKQSLDPVGNTEVINGWAVKKSPLEGLSKMAQALSANYIQDKTDSHQLELAKALQGRLGSVASGGGAGLSSDDAATAALGTNSNGPTNTNAATQTQLMAPVSAPDNAKYGNQNLLRSLAINALGGDQASGAFWKDQESTDAAKRGRELGYTIAQDRTNEDEKRFKDNYISPVNARPGSILRDPKTNKPMAFNPHVPDGFIPSFDSSGNVNGMQAIPGALSAIGGVEQAKTLGVGEATPTVAYDAGGKPLFSTKATDVRRATGSPPAGSGIVENDPKAGAREIARITESLPAVTDPASRKLLQDQVIELKRQAAAYPQTGSVMPKLPPGLEANADAAQKASAQTMHESYGKLQSGNASTHSTLEAIDKMLKLGASKNWMQVGPLATKTTAISPDAAEYEKSRANLIALIGQQNGSGGTDAARAITGESVPDFGKPQAAIADGLGTLRNQALVQQAKANFLTPHYQAGDSKQFTQKQNEFDQNISPSMMPILRIAAGPERAALLQKAAKDPDMKTRLNWAIENGLLK